MSFAAALRRFSPHDAVIDAARIPDIVYHYTDAAGLVGMLSSGTIWATDYRYLNDRSELRHTMSLVQDVLAEQLKPESAPDDRELYSNLLERFAKWQDDPDEIFIFSLSGERGSLSQWRGYAKDGKGFTVGLSGQELYNQTMPDDAAFAFLEVDYDRAPQSRGISGALQAARTELTKRVNEGGNRKSLTVRAAAAFDVVWNRSIINKHASFSSEKEWRVSCIVTQTDHDSVLVRSRGTDLVPYIEVDVQGTKDGMLPIIEIGIGPGFQDSDPMPALKALCRQHGYDPIVYRASAPYRSG